MKTITKIGGCIVLVSACLGVFTWASLTSHYKAVAEQEVRVDLHMLQGVIPCAIVSKGGKPIAIDCKWDHVQVETDDGEEDEPPVEGVSI